MMAQESKTLTRECEVTQIPSGSKMKLSAGSQVTVMQSLGGTYTLLTDQGYMVRLESKDLDAIGLTPSSKEDGVPGISGEEVNEKTILELLKTVYDPEIPVNVVDLGLIYDCRVTPLEEGKKKVEVKMSMTAPGCGMGDILREDVRAKIFNFPGIKEVEVELVWDPPWNPDMMSEAAKLQLGMM